MRSVVFEKQNQEFINHLSLETMRYNSVKEFEVQMIVQNGLKNLLALIERKLDRPGSFDITILSFRDPAKLSCVYKVGSAQAKFLIEKMCRRDEAFYTYEGEEYREDEMHKLAKVIAKGLRRQDELLKARREVDEAARKLEEAKRAYREAESYC